MAESQTINRCPTCGHRVGIKMHNLPDILRRQREGESLASIGRHYGVTRSRIAQIVKEAKEDAERESAA